MAESLPSRVLNISGIVGNDNLQQYVEVGSNTYIGTKDGMKYKLVQTTGSKLSLVETLSDSNASLNVSKSRSLLTTEKKGVPAGHEDQWTTPSKGAKIIKLMALKSEPSPCRGQGDEVGNSVLSSPALPSISSLKSEIAAFQEIPLVDRISTHQDRSQLTYTTLLPKQEKTETLNRTYYSTPPDAFCSFSTPPPAFPPPLAIRPARYTRRSRVSFVQATAPFSPIPRARAPRGRRPRRASSTYQYTPQILHSTPTAKTSLEFSLSSGSPSFQVTPPSMEYPRVPNNTPTSPEDIARNEKAYAFQMVPQLTTVLENFASPDPKEAHNEKERNRRLRIKNSCDCMRSLLPVVTEKMDNASIFELAVNYIDFVKATVGNEQDLEFLQDYYVY